MMIFIKADYPPWTILSCMESQKVGYIAPQIISGILVKLFWITIPKNDHSAAKDCHSFAYFLFGFCQSLSEKLKNFPLVYDLFITCTDDSVLNECGKVFKRDQKINKIKIKKTPNRGRNFGPLLVEFGHEICGYDLFCHLHSKKSLYSGREQTAWANYLIEYLIGDSTVVWNIIKIFDAYKNYGVYFPVTFWSLPCWANHWLKINHSLQSF